MLTASAVYLHGFCKTVDLFLETKLDTLATVPRQLFFIVVGRLRQPCAMQKRSQQNANKYNTKLRNPFQMICKRFLTKVAAN